MQSTSDRRRVRWGDNFNLTRTQPLPTGSVIKMHLEFVFYRELMAYRCAHNLLSSDSDSDSDSTSISRSYVALQLRDEGDEDSGKGMQCKFKCTYLIDHSYYTGDDLTMDRMKPNKHGVYPQETVDMIMQMNSLAVHVNVRDASSDSDDSMDPPKFIVYLGHQPIWFHLITTHDGDLKRALWRTIRVLSNSRSGPTVDTAAAATALTPSQLVFRAIERDYFETAAEAEIADRRKRDGGTQTDCGGGGGEPASDSMVESDLAAMTGIISSVVYVCVGVLCVFIFFLF